MPQIKLQTNDEKCFTVDIDIATCSGTIKNILEDLDTDGLEDEVILLPNISADVLEKIIEWATHHKDDPQISEEEGVIQKNSEISEWDQKFLEVDSDIFFAIIKACNYLDINRLLETCCKHTANLVRGKNANEIRQIFNMKPQKK